MTLLNEACKKENGSDFMNTSAEQKTALLIALDKESKEYQKIKNYEDPTHYFIMMKQLTLLGYFTSEEGATHALRYIAVPGKYDGNVTYKKGDKAWAT
jgi:inorganic pyrophosphatase